MTLNNQNEQSNNTPTWNNSLNDWLENDIKQFTYPTQNKCSLNHIISKDNKTPLLEHVEPSNSIESDRELTNTKDTPINLLPIINVYSLLNSIRQTDQLKAYQTIHSPPPSPVLNIKRKRGNNRIPVDIVVKRQRNTDAARRSRQRKIIKIETLEKRADTLQTENKRLQVKVAVLETEVQHAADQEKRNRERVLELEAKLAMAHKQLVQAADK